MACETTAEPELRPSRQSIADLTTRSQTELDEANIDSTDAAGAISGLSCKTPRSVYQVEKEPQSNSDEPAGLFFSGVIESIFMPQSPSLYALATNAE